MEHPWLLARIREVEAEPNGHLDLWGRDHRKSTVITFGKTIQDILASHGEDPLPEWGGLEPTFGLFSHTRPAAKAFLRQIKREFETNAELKALFPDILWSNPEREAPTWSEDAGLVVRRKTNPKEATVEAWGVVDGQPIGKHFAVIVDDDIVTLDSVGTPEMIQKTTDAWSLHLNLGTADTRLRVIGTRYSFADSYKAIMDRGAAKPRIRAATADGTLTGAPVFLTREQFDRKVREMGSYVASAQLLLNPVADSRMVFKREWMRRFDPKSAAGMNLALLVDPAGGKGRHNDFTAMVVLARAADENTYLIDAVRDRMNLKERTQCLMDLHRKHRPLRTAYEKYGLMSDIEHIKDVQARESYRFDIIELGGSLSKIDRINRLMPLFEEGSFYLPESIMRTQSDGKTVDVVHALVEEEFCCWPVPQHDDMLDAMSRIFDVELPWPKPRRQAPPDRYADRSPPRRGSWMTGGL